MNEKHTEPFSARKRAQSFANAGRGMQLFFATTHSAWIQGIIFLIALSSGVYFSISSIDWMFLILAGGVVFAAEAFNTAIEIDIDLTSPEYHPYARDTKDVAAGAVLMTSIAAAIIGAFIFAPHVLSAIQF